MSLPVPPPIGLLAELTHRCPLACPYCSNPLALEKRQTELDAATWIRIFGEAAAMGVLQLHLSGGEPLVRQDLEIIVAGASAAGLYCNLITSGLGLTEERMGRLAEAGVEHVQLSLQDAASPIADRIGGREGAHARKLGAAGAVRKAGLPLTVNVVLHRHNIGSTGALVALALALGAERIELAHAQYYAWAALNRAALLPSRDDAMRALDESQMLQAKHRGEIRIDIVTPDYFAQEPKACMGGWGRKTMNITPSGKVLPCHAAETIPGLDFWNARDRGLVEIWQSSPAFEAFRGEEWMPEICRSCDRRTVDFGGCRCQALALTGQPDRMDPVCRHSPEHHVLRSFADATSGTEHRIEDALFRR